MLNKEQLEQQLLEYNKAYRLGEAVISDNEYNDILDEYKKRFPEDFKTFQLKLLDNAGQQPNGKVKLPFVIGSLNKAKFLQGPAEIEYYTRAYVAAHGVGKAESYFAYVTPKLDGCSLTLIYEDGKLKQALTRGDGFYGEDKTQHALCIPSIPKELNGVKYAVVRGEAILSKASWEILKSKVEYSAPRNAVAGILNRKTPNKILLEMVDFVAYRLLDFKPEEGYSHPTLLLEADRALNELRNGKHITRFAGAEFSTMLVENVILSHLFLYALRGTGKCKEMRLAEKLSTSDMRNLKHVYDDFQQTMVYEIDGIVVDLGYISDKTKFMENELNEYYPHHMFAIKFDHQIAEAEVDHIDWDVSKGGYLKPVAVFKQGTLIGGVTVNRCTLYNVEYVISNYISKGSILEIMRSGDVIPKCIRVKGRASRTKYNYGEAVPNVCPICGAPVEDCGVELRCTNDSCSGKLLKEISDFLVKLDVNYADTATLKAFGINSMQELITWKLPTKKSKIRTRFESEMKKVWRAPKERVWAALNWNGVSWETWKKIFHFMPLDAFKAALDQDVKDVLKSVSDNVWGVAEKTINQIVSVWPSVKPIYEQIVSDERYQNTDYTLDILPQSDALALQSICFSGSFSKKKDELEKLAQLNGGTVRHSFTKGSPVTILVTNTDVANTDFHKLSAKEKLAKECRITIKSEAEFTEMLEVKDL